MKYLITDEPFETLELKGDYDTDVIALVHTVKRNPENLMKVIMLNPREQVRLYDLLGKSIRGELK